MECEDFFILYSLNGDCEHHLSHGLGLIVAAHCK